MHSRSRVIVTLLVMMMMSQFHGPLFGSSPWPLLRYDRQGTNYDAAVVGYASGLVQALSLPLANGADDNILLGDVNGDGHVEIVILEGASLSVCDYTGATLATIDLSAVSHQGLTMLTDIDADGVLEMGVGFNLQDYSWGCRFYNVATHQGATDGHWGDDWGDVVVDIDGDGDEECVVSNWSPAGTYTLVLGAGLTVLDSTSMSGEIMLAADILSNPGLELILRYGSTLKITDLAFNELWSVTTGGESNIGRWVRTADLDGDDQAELIFESDQLYVYSGTGLGIGDGPAFSIPKGFTLRQNYPNPFNPSTTITFDIPGVVGERRPVTLGVYDLRGRLVRTLMAGDMDPGRQAVHWDGRDDRGESVSSGMYLYRLRMGEETRVRKMTLLK